jgi:hypothetical protein
MQSNPSILLRSILVYYMLLLYLLDSFFSYMIEVGQCTNNDGAKEEIYMIKLQPSFG